MSSSVAPASIECRRGHPHELESPVLRLRPSDRAARAGPAHTRSRRPGRQRSRPRLAAARGDDARALRDRPSRRRAQRGAGAPLARPRPPHRPPHPDPRRRRAERDRPRAGRGPRSGAHRGAPRGPPLRRSRAVLRARLRVRLLGQRRGDPREMGARRDPRRRGARHPDLSTGRDSHPAARGAHASAPLDERAARARGLPGRGPARQVPRADPKRPPALAGGADLPGRGGRKRRDGRRVAGQVRNRRLRSAPRHERPTVRPPGPLRTIARRPLARCAKTRAPARPRSCSSTRSPRPKPPPRESSTASTGASLASRASPGKKRRKRGSSLPPSRASKTSSRKRAAPTTPARRRRR